MTGTSLLLIKNGSFQGTCLSLDQCLAKGLLERFDDDDDDDDAGDDDDDD